MLFICAEFNVFTKLISPNYTMRRLFKILYACFGLSLVVVSTLLSGCEHENEAYYRKVMDVDFVGQNTDAAAPVQSDCYTVSSIG